MKRPSFFSSITKSVKRISEPKTLEQHAEWEKKLVFSLAKSRFPSTKQLSYLPKYLTPKERIIVRSFLLIAVASFIFLGIRFYQRHISILPRPGGEYVEAIVGQPQYINPVLAQNNDTDTDLVRLMYSGLLRFNEQEKIVPDLAESYEIGEDQKSYTIKLKPNLHWHDGEPLTANDVMFTIETIQDPATKSPLAASLKGVKAEQIDDRTIKFTIDEPFAPFLSSLTFGILPAHIWSDVASANLGLAEYNLRPVGSGPYQFASLQKNKAGDIKSYTLSVYPGYYGQKPYITKLTFKLYPDFESAIEALKSRAVEGVSFIPRTLKGKVADDTDINLQTLKLPQYTAVFLNQKNALLKDKVIRQALTMSIDKAAILQQVLGEDGTIANGPIPPGFLGYNADLKTQPLDIQAAKKLLDDNGWPFLAGQQVRKKKDTELRIKLTTVDQPEYVATANLLKQYWEAINIGVEVEVIPQSRIEREILRPRNFDALLYGELIGFDPDPFPFWHSSQSSSTGLNLSSYYNKQVDKLLQDARMTNNAKDREAKYIEFQNILAADIPAIFLFSPTYIHASSKQIKGITADRLIVPADRFNGVMDWYIKTRRSWK